MARCGCGVMASAVLFGVVQVVVDQIAQVLVNAAVELNDLKVFGVAFQREHQQPHGCECVGVHFCGGRWWLAAIAADLCIIASQRTCGTFVAAGNDKMQWTESGHRRESWITGGWNVGDDDCPSWPEPSPQARRYWRLSAPTSGAQCEPASWHVPQDAAAAADA